MRLILVLLFNVIYYILNGCKEPKLLQESDTLENAKIQPAEALAIASPFLEEKATYNWRGNSPLKTYITLYGKHYYIMSTNYPAKTIYFFLRPAVKVNIMTGRYSFIKHNK